MSKFFHITNDLNQHTNDALESSCKKRRVEYVEVEPTRFDYFNYQLPKKRDFLYRSTSFNNADQIEQFLFSDKLATFYCPRFTPWCKIGLNQSILLAKNKISIPKTVYSIPINDGKNRQYKNILKRAASELGGFPLLVKVTGGSHGIGVIRADSFPALFSLLDYLGTLSVSVVIRQFIDFVHHARLIVLGKKVIDSIEYIAPHDDFRTNVGVQPSVRPMKFSKSVERLAVKGTMVSGCEFGGVDILIDKNNKSYIIEINNPCYFPRAQENTGTDISGLMIDYLIRKSKKL